MTSSIGSSRSSARVLAVAATTALLGACADVPTRVVAPTPSEPVAAVAPGLGSIVLASSRFPSDFGARVAALGGKVRSLHAGAGIAMVDGVDAAALKGLPGVREAFADEVVSVNDRRTTDDFELTESDVSGASQLNPATALRYSWQWNMNLIGADAAWSAGKLGDAGVTVAILDSGIDYDAPDLNGLVDLSRSTSFATNDNALTATYFPGRHPINDYDGHGTNVATQVSSKAFALAGVTSKTTLMGVKVLGYTGSGAYSWIFEGMLWAADHGADVANMSLGGSFAKTASGRFASIFNRVVAYGGQRGTLFVVAAGNDFENLDKNGNTLQAMCGVPHVLCVSAVGPLTWGGNGDTFAQYSNYGRSAIDVAGPGGNADFANGLPVSAWPWGPGVASFVWSYCAKYRLAGLTTTGVPVLTSCISGNRLTGMAGTSQATPHVSGLAALLVAEYGHGQPSQLKQKIRAAVVDLGQPGVDPYFGKGRIDVRKALGL